MQRLRTVRWWWFAFAKWEYVRGWRAPNHTEGLRNNFFNGWNASYEFPRRQTSPITHRLKCSPKPPSAWIHGVCSSSSFPSCYASLFPLLVKCISRNTKFAIRIRLRQSQSGIVSFDEWTLCSRQQSLLVRACWTIWVFRRLVFRIIRSRGIGSSLRHNGQTWVRARVRRAIALNKIYITGWQTGVSFRLVQFYRVLQLRMLLAVALLQSAKVSERLGWPCPGAIEPALFLPVQWTIAINQSQTKRKNNIELYEFN